MLTRLTEGLLHSLYVYLSCRSTLYIPQRFGATVHVPAIAKIATGVDHGRPMVRHIPLMNSAELQHTTSSRKKIDGPVGSSIPNTIETLENSHAEYEPLKSNTHSHTIITLFPTCAMASRDRCHRPPPMPESGTPAILDMQGLPSFQSYHSDSRPCTRTRKPLRLRPCKPS